MNKDMQSKLALLRNRQNKQIETKGKVQYSSNKMDYLNLEAGMRIFRPPFEDKKTTVQVLFDVIPFRIKTKNHPNAGSILKDDNGNEHIFFNPGDTDYKLEIHIHSQIGTENIKVLCPKVTFMNNKHKSLEEKKCPICEERDRLMFEEKRPWDDKLVESLKPKRRILYSILADNKEGEQEMQIMDMPFVHLEKEILKMAELNKTGYITFADLEDGRTIQAVAEIESSPQGKCTKYGNVVFLDREPFDLDIIDEAIALDSLLNIRTYDELKKIFYETDSGDVIVEPEVKEEVKEEKLKRERRVRVIKEEKKEVNPCPAGKEFGYDNNLHDECADCPEKDFDKCAELFDDLKKEGKITE